MNPEAAVVLVVLALLVLLVAGLAWAAARTGRAPRGCCVPADPRDDLRMREALVDDGPGDGWTGDRTRRWSQR